MLGPSIAVHAEEGQAAMASQAEDTSSTEKSEACSGSSEETGHFADITDVQGSTAGDTTAEQFMDESAEQGLTAEDIPSRTDETEERQKYFARLKRAKRNYMRIRDIPSHFGASKSTIKNALRSIVSPVLRFLDSRFSLSHKMCLAYEKECKKYISVKTQQASILTLAELGDRFTWDNKDLTGPTSRVPFEFLDLPLPNGYLKVLEKSYGNWKKPVKVGTNHGGVIFDCYKPYDEYLKER